MAAYFIAEDANDTPTVWRRDGAVPIALVRKTEVDPEVWALITRGLEVQT